MAKTELDNTLEQNTGLIDEANKLMTTTPTEDDIMQLQILKRKISNLYSKATLIASSAEYNYNRTRTQEYNSLRDKAEKANIKVTDSYANNIAKDVAEKLYWNYRERKATANWIKASITAISEYCIHFYTKEKHTKDAMLTTGGEE